MTYGRTRRSDALLLSRLLATTAQFTTQGD